MHPTVDDEAKLLAQKHFELEEGMQKIFLIKWPRGRDARTIGLLEVNQSTVESGIMPLRFGPNPRLGFYHPWIIVELTPDEFKKLMNRQLRLPRGWFVADEIPRQQVGKHL